jgi:hypothetical protein
MAGTDGSRHERLSALAAWLEAQPGASASWKEVEIVSYGEAGFGFRAASAIAQGAVLCSIPIRLAFSALSARTSPTLGPLLQRVSGLRDDDVIALLLLHERARGAASARWPHLASLPAAYDATVCWSADELRELEGSPLGAETTLLLAQTAADFAELQTALLAPHPELWPAGACALEDYRWALATIWSRAMDLPVGERTMRVVVPWADLHNHDPALPVCHAHERTSNAVVVLAGRDFQRGDAVCINYGRLSAAAALRLHGFIPAGAPVEVPLYAEMSDEAELYAAKRRLLDRAGIAAGAPFMLTREEPLPAALLLSLRAQRMSVAELAAFERDGLQPGVVVSDANEEAVLRALHGGLEAMLGAYPTTSEADEALLASADSLPARRRAAVELRLAEKRVLRAGVDLLERALQDPQKRIPAAGAAAGDSDDEPPPQLVEELANKAMATGQAPEAAAALTAYFETLLAETEGAAGTSALDGLD